MRLMDWLQSSRRTEYRVAYDYTNVTKALYLSNSLQTSKPCPRSAQKRTSDKEANMVDHTHTVSHGISGRPLQHLQGSRNHILSKFFHLPLFLIPLVLASSPYFKYTGYLRHAFCNVAVRE